MAGHGDDGERRLAPGELVPQVQAAGVSHADFQHEAAGALGIVGGRELVTRGIRLDREAR